MAAGDFNSIAGRQRAVWPQPGGHVLVGGTAVHFEAVVIEAGTVVREDFFMLDDTVQHTMLRIPIMVVPAGATL